MIVNCPICGEPCKQEDESRYKIISGRKTHFRPVYLCSECGSEFTLTRLGSIKVEAENPAPLTGEMTWEDA